MTPGYLLSYPLPARAVNWPCFRGVLEFRLTRLYAKLFSLHWKRMDIWAKIAEQKIREAMARGEFDNLPFHGQPIIPEDLSGVPEHLRMTYKIMKNAGILPQEMQLKQDIVTLHQLIAACEDDEEKRRMHKKMNEKILRFNIMMEKKSHTSAYKQYQAQIMKRFG